MIVLSKFAENLSDLLFDTKLSQKELAEKTGLTESSICYYLQGNCMPNLKAAVILAEFFNVSIDFLVGRIEENSNTVFKPCPPFSERLKLYLDKSEMSGHRLCKEVGIADSRFYQWRDGTNFPSIESVEKLANYFKCSIDEFVGREN